MRPLVVESFQDDVRLSADEVERAIVRTKVALGHGRRESLADVIVIDPELLERGMTAEAALVVEQINRRLRDEERHCLLIGPGRWGSQDPWLGIPVSWPQISTARAIVETDFSDLQVEPSFGSHFFHNLTCFGVAFFAVHQAEQGASIRWSWFREQPFVTEEFNGAIRHLRFDDPLQVLVDGESGTGVILPPLSP